MVTGRVTDAALVVGPGRVATSAGRRDDLDALAGAVVAGHVIECGTQATGGNYSFFDGGARAWRTRASRSPRSPPTARRVITKHPGTGGAVSVGTVTAQLLYEIGGPPTPTPTSTARFDTIELTQDGPDRVRVSRRARRAAAARRRRSPSTTSAASATR